MKKILFLLIILLAINISYGQVTNKYIYPKDTKISLDDGTKIDIKSDKSFNIILKDSYLNITSSTPISFVSDLTKSKTIVNTEWGYFDNVGKGFEIISSSLMINLINKTTYCFSESNLYNYYSDSDLLCVTYDNKVNISKINNYSVNIIWNGTLDPYIDTLYPNVSDDDIEEIRSTGDTIGSSSDLEMGADTGVPQLVGINFKNVQIPQGVIVDEAKLNFMSTDTIAYNNIQVNVSCEYRSNSTPFSNTVNYDISSRLLSSNYTTLSRTVSWSSGQRYNLSQSVECIQEILNFPNWTSGNTISLVFWNNGTLAFNPRSVDSAWNNRAILMIRYHESGTTPDSCSQITQITGLKQMNISNSTLNMTWDVKSYVDKYGILVNGSNLINTTLNYFQNYSLINNTAYNWTIFGINESCTIRNGIESTNLLNYTLNNEWTVTNATNITCDLTLTNSYLLTIINSTQKIESDTVDIWGEIEMLSIFFGLFIITICITVAGMKLSNYFYMYYIVPIVEIAIIIYKYNDLNTILTYSVIVMSFFVVTFLMSIAIMLFIQKQNTDKEIQSSNDKKDFYKRDNMYNNF